MKKIIDYALFDLKPQSKYLKLNHINQINHNATNFIGDCGNVFVDCLKNIGNDEDLMIRLFFDQTVDRFISKKNKLNTNTMYAGHFQRFIQNFLRIQMFSDGDKIIQKIIPFLINNCQILAYKQLLSSILSDFSTVINKSITYDIIEQMLHCSFLAVKFTRNTQAEKRCEDSGSLLKENFREENQPFGYDKKHIPLLSFNFNQIETIFNDEDLNPPIKWKSRSKIIDDQYQSEEDAETVAYLLLMSLRTSIKKQTDLLELFRHDDNHNFLLIEALLYCGTRCSYKSIISLEAFKILDIIFNGSISLHIDPWKLLEEDKKQLNFYSKYADRFCFDSKNVTTQMINALPIFWNHRYNIESYKMSEEEKAELDVSDYYSNKKRRKISKEKGETALEILQPCLLSEPPISSQLIFEYHSIMEKFSKKRIYLVETKSNNVKTREEMISMDMTYLSFYQHQIDFGEYKMMPFARLVEIITPISPIDELYYKPKIPIRPVLNGFICNFMKQMSDSDNNKFFELDDDGVLTNLSRSKI